MIGSKPGDDHLPRDPRDLTYHRYAAFNDLTYGDDAGSEEEPGQLPETTKAADPSPAQLATAEPEEWMVSRHLREISEREKKKSE